MEKVRTLLVGIGGYGENYIKEFFSRDIENATLVAVADPFISKSPYKDEIEKRGIAVYTSPAEAYLKGKVDLTVISSPIHTHYSYVMGALESGSNVLVEKPVVMDMSKMEKLIEKERETGLFVAVGYQLCYSRDVLALKDDINSGLFGAPVRMRELRMMRRGDSYYNRNGWAGKLSCHGEFVFDSPLSNACAHQVENMLFMMDGVDVESVDGALYKARRDIENFDAAAIRINTTLGVPLYYYTAHCLDEKKVGPIGTYEFERARVEDKGGTFSAHFKDGSVKEYSMDKGERLQKLYDSIDSVINHERPSCSLESTMGHIKVTLMAEDLPLYIRYDAIKKSDDGDEYYAIPGLADEFMGLYDSWSLPKGAKLG